MLYSSEILTNKQTNKKQTKNKIKQKRNITKRRAHQNVSIIRKHFSVKKFLSFIKILGVFSDYVGLTGINSRQSNIVI